MSADAWLRLMSGSAGEGIDKQAMNRLVMNWLIVEGYQGAAEQFQQETDTQGQEERRRRGRKT
jgi:hypothetical protein